MVTLLHWDLPEALDSRYGGLLNKDEFVADYVRYARVVFAAMGSTVRHWITFNEPWCSAILGYSTGDFARGRTSNRAKSTEGDSSVEPWVVGHNISGAHGSAVRVYREEFKGRDGGEVGITLIGDWAYPFDASSADEIAAAQRRLEFAIAWFADPIYHGTYPASMRQQLGARLRSFTPSELALIHGSHDVYGMNHYCAHFVRHLSTPPTPEDYLGNVEVGFVDTQGREVGPETQSRWLRPNPPGFRRMLGWISGRYGGPRIYVTENGTCVKGENELTREERLEDEFRVEYFRGYVRAMAEAVGEDGVDVRGYWAWSLMDIFEWADGYETRFGVTYVDYEGGQKRDLKKSARALGGIFEGLITKG